MEKQFIVEQLQEALGVDGHLPGNALSSAVETPDEIWKKLDVISQSKGKHIYKYICLTKVLSVIFGVHPLVGLGLLFLISHGSFLYVHVCYFNSVFYLFLI